MGWGNAIAAGIQQATQLLDTGLSSFLSYDANRKLQQKQMKWQEKMSNTAHQREIKDLRQAGLNPILSGLGGTGASTPSGTGASADMNISTGDAYATYLGYKQQKEQNELLKQQQATEQAKQTEIAANNLLTEAKTLTEKTNATWIDRLNAMNYKRMGQEILESQGRNALAGSQIELNKTLQDLKRAETKYTNEKSRGHNILNADTYSRGITGFINKIGRNFGKDYSYMDIYRND